MLDVKNNAHSFIVFGASGFISNYIIERFNYMNINHLKSNRRQEKNSILFDLETPQLFNYQKYAPNNLAIFSIAISSPDFCKNNYKYSHKLNVTNTIYFIRQFIKHGGRVIFFSSDLTYNNSINPQHEFSYSNPINIYGKMKKEVEEEFSGVNNFKSIRLSYVFSKHDKFTQMLLEKFIKNENVEIFHPFYRSIVYIEDVVKGIIIINNNWEFIDEQIINFGGPECLSRLELVELFSNTVMPNLKYKVQSPKTDFFIDRPQYINMNSTIFSNILNNKRTRISDAINREFNFETK